MRVPLVLQCEADSKHMHACLEQVSVFIQLQAARGAGCLDQLLVHSFIHVTPVAEPQKSNASPFQPFRVG
jgi:hypothetical protein